MIHQLNIYGKDKVDTAIDTLRFFEPPDGYYLAFSGGKDSVVIKALADMAGVKYDAHYAVTSVDPPELVRFVKTFPDVTFDHQRDDDGKPYTMWNLIVKKQLPPIRTARFCCQYLKETCGEGRTTVTGVRWDESNNRKANQGRVTIYGKKTSDHQSFSRTNRGGVVLNEDSAQIILNNDNDESREVVDFCIKQRKTIVNPIIDWDESDVWEFIHENNLRYCELYDEGFKRLGCIGCPLAGHKAQERDFKRWPKYKELYTKAFQKMLDAKPNAYGWKTGEEVMEWWLAEREDRKKYSRERGD